MWRCLVSEVDDGTGQEDSDRLIRCLAEDDYQVWDKRDKLKLYIIHGVQTLPRNPSHSNDFQATQEITSCKICSRDRILRDMWVRIFYVRFPNQPQYGYWNE